MNSLKHIPSKPLKNGLATEVSIGVDRILDGTHSIAELEALWRTYPLLVFRRQALLEEELLEFSSMLGECEAVSRKDILSPYSDKIIYFSTLKYADGRNLGGFSGGEDVDWHSDQTFRPRPSTGAILYGVEVPPRRRRYLLGRSVSRLRTAVVRSAVEDRRPCRHIPICEASGHHEPHRTER